MDYRSTLNLPQTAFPMKADLARREPELLKKWEDEDLYGEICRIGLGRPLYILHDGPPYANGHLHMGHALNKILKDIILKSKRMAGFNCPYVPGWDCHGLPIELNVDQELGEKKGEIDKLAFRAICRRYAAKWVNVQRAEFKRLGIFGDWQNPYLTTDHPYEAAIAREFNNFLLKGLVNRSRKPVHWCASCRTALAEAEVEYADHSSPAIYVKFPLTPPTAATLSKRYPVLAAAGPLAVLIWTTTPWTLPANVAVALHPDLPYAAVAFAGEVLLMAAALVEQVAAACAWTEYQVLATMPASALLGQVCRHPLAELKRESLLIAADYVTLESGSGCVHIAPGHGREDYLSGLKHHLPVLSPVDDSGHFTDEAGAYAGLFILKANKQIIADLKQSGALLGEKKLVHSYPHCWRCKKPVMFRATEQWFIGLDLPSPDPAATPVAASVGGVTSLTTAPLGGAVSPAAAPVGGVTSPAKPQGTLRSRALAAIAKVDWIPRWGRERIQGMVAGRPDWCLSRQRAWGVPITAIWCRDCGRVLNDAKIAAKISEIFSQEGADAWFERQLVDFVGSAAELRCLCGSTELVKEEDILDVWFDSGVSFAAVLNERAELSSPADLYLEGSDQHRGWFQSSLLAGVGTRGTAPYKAVLTHGFVVDGQGKKMSKSIGNVIAPEEIIKRHGAEILRLWTASEDYRTDIRISDSILKQLSDAYRKIRNTVRFLLGNLHDFDPAAPRALAEGEMDELDRWILARFEQFKEQTRVAYQKFEFHQVYHGLYNFCTVSLSALYLDIVKDRLYTMPADHPQRRAAQVVLYEICDGLLRLMAPILSFLAAEAWDYLPADARRESSVFLALFPSAKLERLADKALLARWEKILLIRSELTKALEIARRDKVIGHSLDAEVLLTVSGQWEEFINLHQDILQTVSIVSALGVLPSPLASPELSVKSADSGEQIESQLVKKNESSYLSEEIIGLRILVRPAAGEKCERCWMLVSNVGQNLEHPSICQRCWTAIKQAP